MKKAVVIGAGLAGLASAKILSRYYNEVIVFDGGPQPQGQHLHVLLGRGQQLLEQIFPNIHQQINTQDASVIDWSLDTLWENKNGKFPRYPSSVKTYSISRNLIQRLINSELEKVASIRIVPKMYEASDGMDAQLIVMAGGQNSQLGNMVHSEEILPINLTYRSLVFNRADLNLTDFKQYYYQIDPPHTLIGGVICPIEDGKMIVTLIEHENKFTTCAGLDDFLILAERIPGGVIKRVIGNAKPIGNLAVFRKPHIHKRKLNLSKIPENTIIIGDALLSLNPVFGQGMTIALMQVVLLEKMLSEKEDIKKFQKKCMTLARQPYLLSKTGSLHSGSGKFLLQKFLQACQSSPTLHHFFLKRLHYL